MSKVYLERVKELFDEKFRLYESEISDGCYSCSMHPGDLGEDSEDVRYSYVEVYENGTIRTYAIFHSGSPKGEMWYGEHEYGIKNILGIIDNFDLNDWVDKEEDIKPPPRIQSKKKLKKQTKKFRKKLCKRLDIYDIMFAKGENINSEIDYRNKQIYYDYDLDEIFFLLLKPDRKPDVDDFTKYSYDLHIYPDEDTKNEWIIEQHNDMLGCLYQGKLGKKAVEKVFEFYKEYFKEKSNYPLAHDKFDKFMSEEKKLQDEYYIVLGDTKLSKEEKIKSLTNIIQNNCNEEILDHYIGSGTIKGLVTYIVENNDTN